MSFSGFPFGFAASKKGYIFVGSVWLSHGLLVLGKELALNSKGKEGHNTVPRRMVGEIVQRFMGAGFGSSLKSKRRKEGRRAAFAPFVSDAKDREDAHNQGNQKGL